MISIDGFCIGGTQSERNDTDLTRREAIHQDTIDVHRMGFVRWSLDGG